MELKNKLALVTGSTRGIGADMARLFPAEGAEVVITGRDPKRPAAMVERTENVLAVMGEEAANNVAATTMLGRLASTREIAEAALFLASDRSSYLTGTIIHADAGRTAL